MNAKYIFIILIMFTAGLVKAQDVLKGTVSENGSNNRLPDVFVRDNNSKQVGITDNKGYFTIKTGPGHVLIFECPGYVSDTLYVVDMGPKKISLEVATIALREVQISGKQVAFDPHKEYPEVYTKSKVYVMSPTTWFSKEGKDARRLKHYFQHEAEERRIDEVFTRAYVGSIIPLKNKELEDFMVMYRPTYDFLKSNNAESMAVYINDCYKKYKALPPEKRTEQRLN